MKFLFVTLTLLAAAGAMYPPVYKKELQLPEYRFIEAILQDLLNDLKNQIVEEGFDPFDVQLYDDSCTVFDLVNISVRIDDLRAAGVTTLELNSADLSEAGIALDLALSQFEINLGNIDSTISILGGVVNLNLQGSGRIAVYGLGVKVLIVADLSEGLNIQGVEINISLDRVESNVVTLLNGQDFSPLVNELLNETVLELLAVYGDQIEEVLDVIVMRIIDAVLDGIMNPFTVNRNIDIPLCEAIDFILDLIQQLDIL